MQDPGPKPDPEGTYAMLMPFVTVASKGGPHDDNSYVAGWEMGALDEELKRTTWAIDKVIHTANREQADLIAMKNNFKAVITPSQEHPEWSTALFIPQRGL